MSEEATMSHEETFTELDAVPPAALTGLGRGGRFGFLRTKVPVWVAVVLMAAAFAGGSMLRGAAPPAAPRSDVPADIAPVAPPLTEDQLKQGLPQNHPTVADQPAAGSETGAPGGAP